MNTYTRYGAMLASLTLVLGLVACAGETGPRGAAGVLGQGPVIDKAPKPDQDLGEYDSDPANTGDQTFGAQLAGSTGVWRITLDHVLQFDRGTGEPPVIVDSVLYDTDHSVLWLTIDGVDIALEDTGPDTGEQESFGCLVGVAEPCVRITGTTFFPSDAPPALLYANISQIYVDFGPAMDSTTTIVVGVKTAIADMPMTGSATYLGYSYLAGPYTDANGLEGTISQIGSVTMNVDFGLTEDQVDWESVKGDVVTDSESHLLNSLATIEGNSYSGDLSGTITGTPAELDPLTDHTLVVGGTLEGSFYGPAADTSVSTSDSESAGLFSWADTAPTDADLGGDGSGDSAVGGGGGEFVTGQGGLPAADD